MQNETISTPSYNTADILSETGQLEFFQKILFMKMEKVAPAQIISYDRDKNRATVQILNYSITSTGDKIARKPLNDIPVQVFGGGEFCLSFPIKQGDIGFLIASDSDISVWKKLLQLFAPATYQKHRYKDGIFFPLILNGFTFSADENNAVLLTSTDGNTKISLKPDYITISAKNTVINTTISEINATTATITAQSTINGNLTVNGNITSTGIIKGSSVIDNSGATGTFQNEVTVTNGIVKSGA